MKFFVSIIVVAFLITGSYGIDIKLSDGTILENIKIAEISFRGITVFHSTGAKKILPNLLTEESQQKLKSEIDQYNQLLQKWHEQKSIAKKKRLEQEKAEADKQQQIREKKQKLFQSEVENLKKQEPQTYFKEGNKIFQKYKKENFDYTELKKLIATGKSFILRHPQMHQKEKLIYIFVVDDLIQVKRNSLVTKSGATKKELLKQIKKMEDLSFAVFSSLDIEDLLIASWYKEIVFSEKRKQISQLADGNSTERETAKKWKSELDSDSQRRDTILQKNGITAEDLRNISIDSQQVAKEYKRLSKSMLCKACKGVGVVSEHRYIHATKTMIDTGHKLPCKACDSLGVKKI